MKISIKWGAALAAAAMLGGCQSIHLPRFLAKARPAPQVWQPSPTGSSAEALEEGRGQLRAGNLSAASALFRIAQQSPDTRAEASNGLAIAYAKLGRLDLADRYFRAALAQDPASERYAANLLRLQQQTMLAQQSGMRDRMAAADMRWSTSAPAIASAVGNVGPGRLARVSRGVVFVATPAELGAAPIAIVGYREQPRIAPDAESAGAAEPKVAAGLALSDKSKTYPFRIELDR